AGGGRPRLTAPVARTAYAGAHASGGSTLSPGGEVATSGSTGGEACFGNVSPADTVTQHHAGHRRPTRAGSRSRRRRDRRTVNRRSHFTSDRASPSATPTTTTRCPHDLAHPAFLRTTGLDRSVRQPERARRVRRGVRGDDA